nr:iron-sulfur cluster-binding protein [uncultured archaeon]
MKLGIFLCTCNNSIDIDFKNVKKSLKSEVEVEVVEIHDQLCQGGLEFIQDDIRRLKLDVIIIAACTEKNSIIEGVTRGIDTFFLNLREHCGWVHERKEATEKAKSMIKAAIHYDTIRRSIPKPKKIALNVGYDVLVIGDEDKGAIEVAKNLSKLANVHLLTNNVREWCDDLKIHIGALKDIRGEIGAFEVEIEKNIDLAKCISCGLCAGACPKEAIQYDAVYTIGAGCDDCGDCVSVCPTGAIELHNREVIRAGQIMMIEKEWDAQFGLYSAERENAFSRAIEIILNLGEIEKPKYLDLDLRRCASGKSELTGCEYCLPCPYNAIWREGTKMVFSEVKCQGCGLCTSLCPLSVPKLHEYPDHLIYSQIEDLLSGDLDRKVLLFACSERAEALNAVGRTKMKYPALLPLFVPCIDLVSEAHILSAFAFGADGVILWGCEDSHHEQNESAVKFAQLALSAHKLGERVLLLTDAEDFAKKVTDFVNKLSPIRKKKSGVINFAKPKREILYELLQNLYTKTGVYPTLIEENTQFPFADVIIGPKCLICNACETLCPTKALTKDKNKINFVYGRCIACGLCEQACPEEAITLERTLDFSRLIEKEGKTIAESELIACAGCGKLFVSKTAFERISKALRESGGRGEVKGELSLEEKLELLRYCEKCRAPKAVVWTYKKKGEGGA